MEWLHGEISRAQAESLLLQGGMRDGLFLVREKGSDQFALSMVVQGRYVHHIIKSKPTFTLNGTPVFGRADTLEELIQKAASIRPGWATPLTEFVPNTEGYNMQDGGYMDMNPTSSQAAVDEDIDDHARLARLALSAKRGARNKQGIKFDPALTGGKGTFHDDNGDGGEAQTSTQPKSDPFAGFQPANTVAEPAPPPLVPMASHPSRGSASNHDISPISDAEQPKPVNKYKKKSKFFSFKKTPKVQQIEAIRPDNSSRHFVQLLGIIPVQLGFGARTMMDGVTQAKDDQAVEESHNMVNLDISPLGVSIVVDGVLKNMFNITDITCGFSDETDANVFAFIAYEPAIKGHQCVVLSSDKKVNEQPYGLFLKKALELALVSANCPIADDNINLFRANSAANRN
eukprot:m.103380 g.103380  ORF g.103380 m.103380 type:complete len:401 (-) comp13808_c0_seq3:105-1307(-)